MKRRSDRGYRTPPLQTAERPALQAAAKACRHGKLAVLTAMPDALQPSTAMGDVAAARQTRAARSTWSARPTCADDPPRESADEPSASTAAGIPPWTGMTRGNRENDARALTVAATIDAVRIGSGAQPASRARLTVPKCRRW